MHATKKDELDQCTFMRPSKMANSNGTWIFTAFLLGSNDSFFIFFSRKKKQFHVEEILCLHSSFSQLKSLVPFKKGSSRVVRLCAAQPWWHKNQQGASTFTKLPVISRKVSTTWGYFSRDPYLKMANACCSKLFSSYLLNQPKMLPYRNNPLFSY